MARPKKEGLDYFPVDVDFDKKVESIIMLHKSDGLMWVIRFWQEAYKTMTGVVDLTGLFGELFANNCLITTEKHCEILNTAIKIQFCYEIEENKYTSDGIQKRISSVSKERKQAILRQKESKVKKSKVKKCPVYSGDIRRITEEEKKKDKESKHKHGEYKHVLLTEKQYQKLISDFGESKLNSMIKNLDEYLQNKNVSYKDHNLTMRNWERKSNNGNDTPGFQQRAKGKYSDL